MLWVSTSATPRRRRSSVSWTSVRAALTSMKGAVSASRTTARVPGSAAWARTAARTVSALAKNRPPSTRSDPVEGGQGRDVDQLDDGGDHHRVQGRLGQVLEQAGEEQQGEDGEGGHDQPRHLGAGPGGAEAEQLPVASTS
jgi:hypothetical protein